jgi:hypothetical protein
MSRLACVVKMLVLACLGMCRDKKVGFYMSGMCGGPNSGFSMTVIHVCLKAHLGDVYTYKFPYKSPYEFPYNTNRRLFLNWTQFNFSGNYHFSLLLATCKRTCSA